MLKGRTPPWSSKVAPTLTRRQPLHHVVGNIVSLSSEPLNVLRKIGICIPKLQQLSLFLGKILLQLFKSMIEFPHSKLVAMSDSWDITEVIHNFAGDLF